MAWTANVLPNDFKVQLLKGKHNFTAGASNAFKAALYDNTGTPAASDTAYGTCTGELAATGGYSTGGAALTITTAFPQLSSTTAIVDIDDVSWSSATFNTYGSLIYNTTNSNFAVAYLYFGGQKSVSAGTFTIVFPTADSTNAIIRIA